MFLRVLLPTFARSLPGRFASFIYRRKGAAVGGLAVPQKSM
jgi:hypothetical protein